MRPDSWTLHEEGQTYELPDDIAKDYLRGNLATIAAGEVERATSGPSETADTTVQKTTRRR